MKAGPAGQHLMRPLRLLFIDPNADWRARFENIQAWLAFDQPVSIAFTTDALRLLRLGNNAKRSASAAAFASLQPLGLAHAFAPKPTDHDPALDNLVLPMIYLSAKGWRQWLRAGSLVAA